MTKPTDRPIIPGDIVVTKIGGPPMIVEGGEINGPIVIGKFRFHTAWFDSQNRLVRDTFDEAALCLWHFPHETPTPSPPQTTPKTEDLNHISVAGNDLITLSEAAIACDQIGWDDTAKALRAIIYQATLTPDWSPLNSEAITRASIGRAIQTYKRYGRACDAPSPPSRPATQGDPGITTPLPAGMTPYVAQADGGLAGHGFLPGALSPDDQARAARAAIDDPLPQDPRLYGNPQP